LPRGPGRASWPRPGSRRTARLFARSTRPRPPPTARSRRAVLHFGEERPWSGLVPSAISCSSRDATVCAPSSPESCFARSAIGRSRTTAFFVFMTRPSHFAREHRKHRHFTPIKPKTRSHQPRVTVVVPPASDSLRAEGEDHARRELVLLPSRLVSERVAEQISYHRDEWLKNLLDSDSEDSVCEPVASVC
jgi:hypothetical protein